MVELGNGDSFFFDFGPGCLRNIISMGHSQQLVQDIFISHLHVDHYHDISYLLPFSAWSGRYTPLRVHGPSGAEPLTSPCPSWGTNSPRKALARMA